MAIPGYGYKKKNDDSMIYVPCEIYVAHEHNNVWKVKGFKIDSENQQFILMEESIVSDEGFRAYSFAKVEFDLEKSKTKKILNFSENNYKSKT